jgi:acetyl esterase/lipase
MKSLNLLFLLFFLSGIVLAQEKPFPLYPKGIPNSKTVPVDYKEEGTGWITKVSLPTLTAFLPAAGKGNGTSIIVIPGGAYIGIAAGHEGADVARKFAEAGITAFLLKYRLPQDLIMPNISIGPIQDAQRALQIVRERAAEWKLDANKVGVIGFSAGGHLASTLGTHFGKSYIENKRSIGLRPDFMALIYPVISMGEYTHGGSKQNLLGSNPASDLVDQFSNEKRVSASTPPTFLVHSQDDKVVPVQNSLLMYEALLKNNVKAEMHLYQAGNHGYGLNNKTTQDQWFERCLNWLAANGFK